MEPLVSIFQLQDADRSPVLAHIHRLHQEGKFKEVSEPFPVALGLSSTGRASMWVSGVGESQAGGETPTLEVSPLPWGLCRGHRSGVQGTSPPGPAQVHAWRGGPGHPDTDPLRGLDTAPHILPGLQHVPGSFLPRCPPASHAWSAAWGRQVLTQEPTRLWPTLLCY